MGIVRAKSKGRMANVGSSAPVVWLKMQVPVANQHGGPAHANRDAVTRAALLKAALSDFRDKGYAAATLDDVVSEIHSIWEKARAGGVNERPRWPMIVLRTPKGWTGPKDVDGKPTEGSWRSHQVPLAELEGQELWIDGFNVLTSFESALSGGVILHARWLGCTRRLRRSHGLWRARRLGFLALGEVGERPQLEQA